VRKHAVGWADGVYLGGGVRAGQLHDCCELVDARGVDVEVVEEVEPGLGDLDALAEGAAEGVKWGAIAKAQVSAAAAHNYDA
jgi:hypothetical protein